MLNRGFQIPLLRRGTARMRGILVAFLVALSLPALAIGVDEPLADKALETRAHAISKGLRCLVCQNQSIEDSNAALARDLRQIVRERVVAGDSDEQVRAYLVARYGDWVLLKPPFNALTAALWLGPAALLAAAGIGVAFYYRRLRRAPTPEAAAPLSADERRRLEALISGETPR